MHRRCPQKISNASSSALEAVLTETEPHLAVLVVHCYGCKVVKALLEYGSQEQRRRVVEALQGQVGSLI